MISAYEHWPLMPVVRSVAKPRPHLLGLALIFATLLAPAEPTLADFTQSGNKLVGTGATGSAEQGSSVALSGDGSTAIVGGRADDSNTGAAWVFTRNGAGWTQQGSKLVGTDGVGTGQGWSVALSADGNTTIVGGLFAGTAGAVWVFTRSNGLWTQQGNKLVATGGVGSVGPGRSVALSADGNTAIVGGSADNSNTGAAWVFVRSNGVWSQQGNKLVGTGAGGSAQQGWSVALSGDGNTAIIGGPADNNNAGGGATWVFTRSNGVWSQQGSKLIGTGAVGTAQQGYRVALSGDGNTAIIGGFSDNSNTGAAWVFVRSNGVWSQQGNKLVGQGAQGSAEQGRSVTLSGDGNTAFVGGSADNSSVGATWVYIRSNGVWSQQGNKLVGTGAVGSAIQGWSVGLSSDGNIGIVGARFDNNPAGAAWIFVQPAAKLKPTATHDFDHDGLSDIVWRHSGGTAAAWLMGDLQISQSAIFGVIPTNWQLVSQRDFNNDGKYDWLWRDSTGAVAIWLMNGLSVLQAGTIASVPANWQVAGTADFNWDGKADILWRDTNTGALAIWLMNGLSVLQTNGLGTVPLAWTVAATDGKDKIFWRDNTGALAV
jgi:hypothetical protein